MEHNIGQWVAKRALLNPNSEAIVDITSGRRQTYVELDARCNQVGNGLVAGGLAQGCLLYTSPSPRDYAASRMPSSA